MRIALVAPLAESVPPKLYGGTERVVAWLADEMVRRGHAVTLFASGDSSTRATLEPGVARALRLSGVNDHAPYLLRMLGEAFRRADEFDVIHSHVDYLAFPFTRVVDTPVVHTLHGRLDVPWLRPYVASFPDLELISISDAQRLPWPKTRFAATIPHGLPRDLFRPSMEMDDYALFLGRISPEKGPVAAIHAAIRAGVPLVIAAKVDPVDRDYFEREVLPLLDHPLLEYVGEVDDAQKGRLLRRARALLHPIDWPEPFGLVFVEALASGTPVVTRARGSALEIVKPDVTAIVVDREEDLAAALHGVVALDRAACRADFEARFTVERMCDAYEAVYRDAMARREADAAEEAVVG